MYIYDTNIILYRHKYIGKHARPLKLEAYIYVATVSLFSVANVCGMAANGPILSPIRWYNRV